MTSVTSIFHRECLKRCTPRFYWTNKYATVSAFIDSNGGHVVEYKNAAILQCMQHIQNYSMS